DVNALYTGKENVYKLEMGGVKYTLLPLKKISNSRKNSEVMHALMRNIQMDLQLLKKGRARRKRRKGRRSERSLQMRTRGRVLRGWERMVHSREGYRP